MSVDKDKVVHQLNDIARERLILEAEHDKMKKRHASERHTLAAQQEAELTPLENRIRMVNDMLHDMVMEHHERLFVSGKRSFALFSAIVSLRKVHGRVSVLDSKAIMEVARHHRLVRKIAVPVREYKFNATMFKAFLATCDEYRPHFEPFIDEVPDHDSLSIRPNDQHETTYDGNRLTNEPITIHPSSPRA